jgi:hypothetical protein
VFDRAGMIAGLDDRDEFIETGSRRHQDLQYPQMKNPIFCLTRFLYANRYPPRIKSGSSPGQAFA